VTGTAGNDPSPPAAVELGSHLIGGGAPCLVIAEIGSNHDGDLDQARRLIDAAARAGAQAVKFQSFRAERLVNPRWPSASGGWAPFEGFERLRSLELPLDWLVPLREHAAAQGLVFLSTPFDEEMADALASAGVAGFKIASGDVTHDPLLRHVAALGRPVLLSTGLATLEEVQHAVAEITAVLPGGPRALVLLHCVSMYPPRWHEVNVRAITTLAEAFHLPVGFSDHTPGHALVLAAVTLGAAVVEKHLTLDRSLPGPDHGFALDPSEFGAMVTDVRRIEAGLGDGRKVPADGEIAERRWARRSVYAATAIEAGTVLEAIHMKIVRPATGLEPGCAPALVGRRALRPIAADQPLTWDDVSSAG
jgi:N-acetylneuraminate synthase/N,N'-diacetyllegionaminate synthase